MPHILIDQWAGSGKHPELGGIFKAIATAGAEIASKIRLAGLDDTYGAAGATNVQGEQQQKLDVFANERMIEALRACPTVAGIVSEEDDEPVLFNNASSSSAPRFMLSFDPLDGSSNIDVNVNVGTIFGVRALGAASSDAEALKQSVLQPGAEQIAAGYIVYGPSVVFVATIGDGVAAFTLDYQGNFVGNADPLHMPEQGPYYSANEANADTWPAVYRDFIAGLQRGTFHAQPYSARYIGSLVADFHRTLLKGGVFLYPPTNKAPKGKLRLQYEANPLALLAEAAGGKATNGVDRILDLEATEIHERTPLVVGSRREVEWLQKLVLESRR